MPRTKAKARTARDDLEMSLSEDDLISGLMEVQGRNVEVVAFGIAYSGVLKEINVRQGYVTIADGEDHAALEFERIESYRLLE